MKAERNRPRRYNAQSRLARAAETRQRILDGARALFNKRGIDKVTIDELAAAADVSPPTVYALFRSKAGILKALMEGTFFGPHYAAIAERNKDTRDPIALLRNTAAISRIIFDTERQEIGLMRGASAFSPELKTIEVELENRRFALQESRARLLVKTFPSARALGLAKVRDIMWMYTGRDVYRMLVMERGWSSDAYEDWLAQTLIQALTAFPAAASRDSRSSRPTKVSAR